MSDEEKKAIEVVNKRTERLIEELKIEEEDLIDEPKIAYLITQIAANKTLLNLIEKKSKEIEELKEERKSYEEEYIYNNPWLYKQLNENYILRVESEQKERKAYIKGTNDAHELCNKKWEDKIKAIIEELEIEQESNREDLKIAIDNLLFQNIDKIGNRISINMSVREILQSLLKKD